MAQLGRWLYRLGLAKLGHGLFGFVSTLSVLVHPILPALSAALFLSMSWMRSGGLMIQLMKRSGNIFMVLLWRWLFCCGGC
jgi:hypothetical protein